MVEALLRGVASRPGPVARLASYVLESRGKRIRPALVLLCASLGGGPAAPALRAAVAVELIHTASLLHDDVIDRSDLRRGVPTVYHRWGAKASVLLGDYLLTRALELLLEYQHQVHLGCLLRAVRAMTEGELRQAVDGSPTSERQYLRMVAQKTAGFMGACCHLGASIGGLESTACRVLYRFGFRLGVAFQIRDDLLDLEGNAEDLGKPVGADSVAGYFTLPLIFALQRRRAHPVIRRLLQEEALTTCPREVLRRALTEVGAVQYARNRALTMARKAVRDLRQLPPGQVRQTLEKLAWFAVERAR